MKSRTTRLVKTMNPSSTSNNLFQTPAAIHGVRTLVDGGVKIELITPELAADELTMLFNLHNKTGYFVFKENTITPKDIPDVEVDVESGEKSPSQRIRAKLYVYWNDNTDKSQPFDNYYRAFMSRVENKIDEMLG